MLSNDHNIKIWEKTKKQKTRKPNKTKQKKISESEFHFLDYELINI